MRSWIFIVLACATGASVHAQVPLKTSVILLGANAANDAIAVPARSGDLAHDLYLQVATPLTGADNKPLENPAGELLAFPLQATTSPADVVPVAIALAGGSNAPSTGPVKIPLTPSTIQRLVMTAKGLRAGATYKGTLVLSAATQSHRWEIALTTGGRGVLKAVPVGPLQFVARPFADSMGTFDVTLRNRSELGPYTKVHAFLEGTNAAPTSDLKSNLLGEAFAFYEDAGHTTPLGTTPLEQDQTVHVVVKRLSPGAYAGALRFAAEGAADDTDDSRLPLVIQVRHHWILPLTVMLVGSVVGWFSSKYVVAVRKARELARQVVDLRTRADHLARRENTGAGWSFSSEASSFALTKVRVTLSQIARLVAAPAVMLTREEDINRRKQDAEVRLSRLELFRKTRLNVQHHADGRPAAQLALGRLLRRAMNLLEEPVFDEARQTEFTTLLSKAGEWASDGTAESVYRAALRERRRSNRIPSRAAVQTLTLVPVRDRILALLDMCPVESAFVTLPPEELGPHDQSMGELVLLWKERTEPWAQELADASGAGQPLDTLFELVDRRYWEFLKTQTFAIQLDTTHQPQVTTFTLIEVSLTTPATIRPERMLRHPLRVVWRVVSTDGTVRITETDGLTLVQYFDRPGTATISATLRFAGEEIPVAGGRVVPVTLAAPLTVIRNPEYRTPRFFSGILEWSVLGIATLFAVATAMSAQYNSTFGSFGQYLALFVWAAGAAAGGNMFKQLGTSSAPGGSAEAALPAK